MAVHAFGRGRAVYISGLPYSFENSRVLYRSILWSAHDEESLHKWFSSNFNVEVHAYVKNGKYCVVWVAANDGNVSAKLEDGTFLATPTGMSKSFITPEKLIRIDARGNVLEAAEGLRPSSEIKMHLRCYEKRDDVWSVIHGTRPGPRALPLRTAAWTRTT